jgi:hypothetical protein
MFNVLYYIILFFFENKEIKNIINNLSLTTTYK